MKCVMPVWAAGVLALCVPVVAWAQVPGVLGYQARLLNADGSAATGAVSLDFSLFDAPVGGTPLWEETQLVALSNGFYAVFLGDLVPLPEGVLNGEERYLQVGVGLDVLMPRQRLASVPYAWRALTAQNLVGGTVDATSIQVNGVPVVNAQGHWVGPPPGGDEATELLLHLDGQPSDAGVRNVFVDQAAHRLVYGAATISAEQSRFGGASAQFTGAADEVISSFGDWRFPTQDFTVDFWYRQTVPCASATQVLVTPSNQQFQFQCTTGAGRGMELLLSTNCSSWTHTLALVPQDTNVWHHFAMARSSGTLKAFVDGVVRAIVEVPTLCRGSTVPWIYFGSNTVPQPFTGFMDEIRVTRGVARWTSDFTPPTQEY